MTNGEWDEASRKLKDELDAAAKDLAEIGSKARTAHDAVGAERDAAVAARFDAMSGEALGFMFLNDYPSPQARPQWVTDLRDAVVRRLRTSRCERP